MRVSLAARLAGPLVCALLASGCDFGADARASLQASEAALAQVSAELAESQEREAKQRERVRELLVHSRALSRLVSGKDVQIGREEEYGDAILRRSSRHLKAELEASQGLGALEKHSGEGARLASELRKATAGQRFESAVELASACELLSRALSLLVRERAQESAQAERASRDELRARKLEVDELRMRLIKAEDALLSHLRDLDRERRKLQKAREALREVVAKGDATSRDLAQAGLSGSE